MSFNDRCGEAEPVTLAPRCPACGWQAGPRPDTKQNHRDLVVEVMLHKIECQPTELVDMARSS